MKKAFTPSFGMSELSAFQKIFISKFSLSYGVVLLSFINFFQLSGTILEFLKSSKRKEKPFYDVVILRFRLRFVESWLLFQQRKMSQIRFQT
jgi:hypothetical protein